MCVGEKAVYNWILRILPDQRDHTVRLSGYVPELFIFILHCESFLQRFVYWYHIFKDYIRSTYSINEVALESANNYFDFMDSLIGFSLIYVRFQNINIFFSLFRNSTLAALFSNKSSLNLTPTCKITRRRRSLRRSRTSRAVYGNTDASRVTIRHARQRQSQMRERVVILRGSTGLLLSCRCRRWRQRIRRRESRESSCRKTLSLKHGSSTKLSFWKKHQIRRCGKVFQSLMTII